MKAVIMAGGEGSRLRPLTCDRPKPLVPVANKPVMEYAIELLKKYGIYEIGVTLQYLPEAIKDYFGDGSAWGVHLHYFVEEVPLGTAGSVKNAETFLDESFLVVSGDALTDFNLAQALDFHRQKAALATLVLTAVDNPLEYGVVITEKDGEIKQFLEKPSWGEVFSDQVNTGIYVLEPEVLRFIPQKQMYDFSKNLFPEFLRQRKALYACALDGYWCDIGNLEQYREAHFALLEGKVELNLQEAYQGEGIWLGTGVDIHPTARLRGPVLLGDFTRIGPHVEIEPYTVVGRNAQLFEQASLKRSILWDGCRIGKKAELRGAVLCRQVVVEANAAVYEGSAIGDKTTISRNSIVKPEVKIWPYKQIGQGVVLNSTLVWGTRNRKNLFGTAGVPGPLNYGITPEIAAKLGAAFGSTLPVGKNVAVSHDGRNAVQMLKNAFVSGLLSTGINVKDLGSLAVPAHRYAIQTLNLEAGVHLKIDCEDQSKVWFEFVDQKGLIFNQGRERKIESIYQRDDFRRVGLEEIGRITPIPSFIDSYRDYALKQVNTSAIRQRRFKLVLDYHKPILTAFMPNLLEQLGIKVIAFNSFDDEQEVTGSRISNALSYLAGEVIKQEADFGAMIDHHAEKLFLADDKGQILDDDLLMLIIALIIFKTNPGARVAVPVTAPGAIEVLAEKYHGQVIRTKTRPAVIMEMVADQEFASGQGRYPQIAFQFDAVLALLKLLDYLSEQNLQLSQIVSAIPEYYLNMQSAECPWEAKGKVMRSLIEDHQSEKVELLDGIKVYKDQGWALVLPDAEEPVYWIYGESFSQEAARELTDLYVEKIKSILARENRKEKLAAPSL